MKQTLIAISIVTLLTACSSTQGIKSVDSGSVTAINNQKLSTNFKRKGVKIEWECSWGTGMLGLTDAVCSKGDIKSIEVIGYATSNGNSENNREAAFKIAEMNAKAKLRHFIHEDVYSTNTIKTLTKNVEKANDKIKQRISNTEEVSMSDDEANKDTNFAVRENTNDIVRGLTEEVRTHAEGILRGVHIMDEDIVDKQTVKVVIRWDKDSDRASNILNSKFR